MLGAASPGSIHVAAASSQVDVLNRLLSNRAQINSEWEGLTPLIAAAREAQVEMVEHLLNRGASPELGGTGEDADPSIVDEGLWQEGGVLSARQWSGLEERWLLSS